MTLKLGDVYALFGRNRVHEKVKHTLLTRYKNYNNVKLHLSIVRSVYGESELRSSTEISMLTGIPRGTVGRVLMKLEEDGFLEKVKFGENPKQQRYKVIFSKEQCELFKKFYWNPPRKRKKIFNEILQTCEAEKVYSIKIK